MLPSIVATELYNCVSDYLRTTFRPTTVGFDHLMDRFIAEPKNIAQGPYVSLGLPFRSGTIGANYFPDIPMQFAPHRHQERAFARLSPPYYQSTLIATGTGSGKTECFLLPVLEHCRQQAGEPGIKAILIYPMNALATDQAKRIAELIYSTPALRGQVTAGLYIGDSDETPKGQMERDRIITDKRIIRESPPDLLLTNYKMLDYLLLQPDAQKLWQHNQPETLRYIIVDEFHTFDGAQGTDLACLLRRLKHRLNIPQNHLACVGTSATLGGEHSRADMLHYAATIFQEPFHDNAIIEEDRLSAAEFLQNALLNVLPVPSPEDIDRLRPDRFDSLEAYLRTQAHLWLQSNAPNENNGVNLGSSATQHTLAIDPSPQQLTLQAPDLNPPLSNQWRIQLGEELQTLPIIQILIRMLETKPYRYDELLETLSRRLALPASPIPDYRDRLLDSLLSLVSAARRQVQRPDGTVMTLPWVTLRVQLWFRELKRMVASVASQPKLLFSDDLTPEQLKKSLPVVHCRDCGATGWAGIRPSQGASRLVPNDLRRFYQEFFSRRPLVTFIFPTDRDRADHQKLCPECLALNPLKAAHCQSCGHDSLILVNIPDTNRSEESRNGQKRLVSNNDCPFCSSSGGLSILGAQAASLTSAMIGVLFTTPFNRDKKLLTFSDSVQDAAHRAGFYGARTYRTTLRTAIAHTIRASNSITLQALVDQFPQYWQHNLGSIANYIATFLPTDLEWLREWDEFVKSDRQDLPPETSLPNLLRERLVWEIVNQFGHRAAVGPSLERSGTCAASFNSNRCDRAISDLHLKLTNEIEPLRNIEPEVIRQFLLGLLHHLRQRGGILQPATYNYINQAGNTYILQRLTYMPRMGPRIPAPIFFTNAIVDRFEQVTQPGNRISWCEDWTRRIFGSTSLLLKDQIKDILWIALDTLVDAELLEACSCGVGRAWGIPMDVIELESGGTVLICDRCGHQLTTSNQERSSLENMICLNSGCTGHYHLDPRTGLAYYRQLYRSGEVRRIMATEHTGLLSRSNRERIEQQFIQGDRRCDPNLLSATSTLEMGINIGDLSTVLLCSVPPAPANFQQRIGRAGRRDGNALIGTVANGKNHDLFFYSDPMRMLAGNLESAGCYLDASAILERQLTAFCLDNWVKTGITPREFPAKLNDVLNAIERQDTTRFPYNWIQFIRDRQEELIDAFLKLFENAIDDRTRQQLRIFIERGEQDEGGLYWRIIDRLNHVRQERTRLSSQIKNISKKLKKHKEEPEALQSEEFLAELDRERSGFRELMRHLNDKHILNFLTDEGLLPNYAFPEAGVTLKSILWRKRSQTQDENGNRYETFTLSYERPGALAIRELVPSGVFYAEGRRVKIDQIDLKLSEPEDWRICRSCNYTVRSIEPEAHAKTCPRCGDPMWSDQGRLRRMLRLRQVMATTSDKESRFGDDSEDRNTSFFQRHFLVDFAPENREKTFLVQDKDFPFGFEYISRTSFREINLGESLAIGETVELSGQRYTTNGFRVCSSCGKVMRGDSAKDHTISCQYRNKPDQAKAEDVLYLYREFESEAIRLLMPDENFWTPQGLHSFVAALQLGLKQKFRGKVDHLRTAISEEPQINSSLRKSYLYLYDTVPGGTGYLRQLIRNPDELLDVFNRSLTLLRACSCEDGCYDCLFAYRNSYDQDETSRKTAVRLFASIVQNWPNLSEASDGLSSIRLNSNFESELERRFIEAIRRYNGKVYNGGSPLFRKDIVNGRAGYYLKIGDVAWTIEPQVTLAHQDGVEIPSRADFVIRPATSRNHSRPIAVFTDGWEFHRDRIHEDLQQRAAILLSGQFWCWSLAWDDVEQQMDSEFIMQRVDGLRGSEGHPFAINTQTVYEQYQCLSMRHLEPLSSFEWLMYYLAQPDAVDWSHWALLRTFAQIDPRSLNPTSQQQWHQTMTNTLGQDPIELWNPPDRFLTGQTSVSPALKILKAVDPQRHKQLDATGSLLLLCFDDQSQEIRSSWIELLRLLNLYQFLPHHYAATQAALTAGFTPTLPLLPALTLSQPITLQDQQWEQIRQLVIEDCHAAVDQMQQEQWSLPEVGYELMDDRNRISAIAELAWIEDQIAVTLLPEDQTAFRQAGWYAILVDELCESMVSLGNRLKGGV